MKTTRKKERKERKERRKKERRKKERKKERKKRRIDWLERHDELIIKTSFVRSLKIFNHI